MNGPVIDVTDANFGVEVLARSQTVPVVVDFWAPWCGPCRTLGPILERLAREQRGGFVLAKLNVDENPSIAETFGIQGIPAVKAFVGGRLVDEFTGALPEPAVRAFLQRLLPTEADVLAAEGAGAAERGASDEAESLFRKAVALDPNHPAARLGLGKLLLDRDPAAALTELERVLEGTPERVEADRLAARVRLASEDGENLEELERQVAENPRNLDSRIRLARALAASGRYDPALSHFLEVVRRDRNYDDQAARKGMLDVFEVLGPRHPLVDQYRSELAKVLYS